MKKIEAFSTVVQIAVDDISLEAALINAGINGSDDFATGGFDELELAAIPLLQSLLPISSTSEGDFSQSTNKDAIKDRLLFLLRKHGKDDEVGLLNGIPKIYDISNLW